MSLKTLSFQMKLTIGAVAVVAAAVVMMVVSNQYQIRKSLHELAGTSIKSFSDGMFAAMELQYSMLDQKVRVDVTLIQNAINDMGLVRLNKFSKQKATIVNQVTKEKEEAEFSDMEVAGTSLYHNYEIVDRVQELAGGTATIFQMLPGKLLRISTNVKKLDGERAVGTYIPDSSPVFKSIVEGKAYYGIAFVVNDWYQTAYLPLRDPRDRIIGAIYVGRRIITPEFRKLMESGNIGGEGYSFLYDQSGKLLIHPDQEGENISEFEFWGKFSGVEDGMVEFTQNGEEMVAYLKKFPGWGWTYGFAMNASDALHGVDKKLLAVSGVIAVIAFVLAVLFILGLIRNVTKPLKCLSGYTEEVSGGNYNACIEYAANDVIGDVINAVQRMTGELKHKLGVAEGLLKGLTIPCVMVDLDDRITYVNQHELDLVQKSGSPEDYIGMELSEFFHGEKGRDTLTAKAMREDTVLRGVEIENVGARGRKYYAQVDSSPLKDLDGELIGGFSIIKDFTAIKEGEARIKAQAEKVTRVAAEADEIAEQLNASSEELTVKVEESSRGAQVQLERASETASAMEEMNATVLEVARNASEVAENAGNAKAKAEEGAELVSRVVSSVGELANHSQVLKESMTSLGKQTEDIGAIMQVIEDIADQTNLLALNAAIEAARAGEAGRGFAVVADEVRKLAEKTMQATKEVGAAISSIQTGTQQNIRATETAVESIEESTELAGLSGKALEEIVSMVEHTAAQVMSIATAAEQQSATSEEINRATEEINVISSQTSQAMGEANVSLAELSKLAAKLKELISTMRS